MRVHQRCNEIVKKNIYISQESRIWPGEARLKGRKRRRRFGEEEVNLGQLSCLNNRLYNGVFLGASAGLDGRRGGCGRDMS